MPPSNIIALASTGGQSLSMAGGTYRILISGDQTGGDMAVIEMLVPPGGGPGPHAHAASHESYYVLEGEVTFRSEAGPYKAGRGAVVHIPKGGAVHAFKNESGAIAKMLCTVAPAGLDAMFREASTPVAHGKLLPPAGPPTEEQKLRMKAIAEKYGNELYPPDYFEGKD